MCYSFIVNLTFDELYYHKGDTKNEKKSSAIILGIIVIFAGIGYGATALGYKDFSIFFDGWWSLFIIIPAFCSLFEKNSNKFTSLAFLVLGIGLLLWQQNILSVSIGKFILPIVVIVFGINIIIGAFTGHNGRKNDDNNDDNNGGN